MSTGLKAALFAAALFCLASNTPASAQNYPTNTIRIVVGFGPGAAADTLRSLRAGRK